jgi:hypothetical protein
MPPIASESQVRALLERHRCPTPFHVVRTWFLGSLASPDLQAPPVKTLEALWGGTPPVFDNEDDARELIGAVVMGLWNRLSRHQQRSAPFHLTRIEVPATREGMATLARTRREELDGFTEGLFGDSMSLDLPERAHRSVRLLGEMRAMFEGARELAENPTKPVDPAEIPVTLEQFHELSRIAEHEIHEAVLSCIGVQQQMLGPMPATPPVLH